MLSNLHYFTICTIRLYQNKTFMNCQELKFRKFLKKNYLNLILINKIANILKINTRDLMPPIQDHYVKIQKYNKNRSWYYPSIKKRIFIC